MTTDEGVHPNQLASVYDRMNPRSWDPDGGGSNLDDTNFLLQQACSAEGLSAQYTNQRSNGVDH